MVIIGMMIVSASFPFLKTRYLIWKLKYTKYLTISYLSHGDVLTTDDSLLIKEFVSSTKLSKPFPDTLCIGVKLRFFLPNDKFIRIDYIPAETGGGGFIRFWHPFTRWFQYASTSEFDKNIKPILEEYYNKRIIEYKNEMKMNQRRKN